MGQFAVRGGIIDLFSVAADDPVRIEFWGDEVESIRTFDPSDQLSCSALTETHLLPVDFVAPPDAGVGAVTRALFDLLPPNTVFVRLGDFSMRSMAERTWERVRSLHSQLTGARRRDAPEPSELFVAPDTFVRSSLSFGWITASEPSGDLPLPDDPTQDEANTQHPSRTIELGGRPPPNIDRNMSRLEAYLRDGADTGDRTTILCDGESQLERLEEILGGSARIPAGTTLAIGALAGGFELELPQGVLRVLNDHEIFRRPRRLRRSRRFRGTVALESLSQLQPGDYVVHMDHGVGRFVRLDRTELDGQILDSLVIEYAGAEMLRLQSIVSMRLNAGLA